MVREINTACEIIVLLDDVWLLYGSYWWPLTWQVAIWISMCETVVYVRQSNNITLMVMLSLSKSWLFALLGRAFSSVQPSPFLCVLLFLADDTNIAAPIGLMQLYSLLVQFMLDILGHQLSRPTFQLRRLAWVLPQGSFQAGGQWCVQDSRASVVL